MFYKLAVRGGFDLGQPLGRPLSSSNSTLPILPTKAPLSINRVSCLMYFHIEIE